MYIRNLTNPTTCSHEAPALKLPPSLTLRFKTTFSIQFLSAPFLLIGIVSYIGMCYLITDCSLGYKTSNVLGCFGLL